MKEEKWRRIAELYDLATKSANSARPKRVLFSWKCPKCNGNLNKESVKELAYLAEGGTEEGNEIIKKILTEAKIDPGVYYLKLNHFSCKCGYEFARTNIEPVSD